MTLFPADLDNLPTNETNETVAKDTHPKLHNAVNEAVNAIEAELGLNPSGEEATVAARLTVIVAALAKLEGATVSSFAGRIGAVVAQAGDYDIAKITGLTAALEGKQPLDEDLTKIAALATTAFGRGILSLADAAAGRGALGLGTAAVKSTEDFDVAGAAATEKSRAETAEALKLAKSSNLSDLASAATARTNLGLGTAATEPKTAFDAAGAAASEEARAKAAEATLATKSSVEILNLGIGGGENQKGYSAAVAGQGVSLYLGKNAEPDTVAAPAVKVARTSAVTQAAINAAEGSEGSDGGDVMAALMGVHVGTAASGSQTVGVAGFAKNASNTEENPDACGIYGVGRITGGTSTKAGAFGAYLVGRRDVNTAKACGVEIQAQNYTETDGSYLSNGASDTKGIWLNANGNADSGVGIQIQNAFGRQFKVGIGFGNQVAKEKTGGVADSSIRDDSHSTTSLDIRGTHTSAIKLAENAGTVDLGKNSITNPPAKLGNPYRHLNQSAGRVTAAAVAGTKYFLVPGSSDVSAPALHTTASAVQPYLIIVSGSSMEGIGTTKLRVSSIVVTNATPSVTTTVGLYPVTGGAALALGAVVEGSTVETAAAATANTIKLGADFAVPADGVYALGYTVSGTPATAYSIQAKLDYHHV